MRYTIHKLTVDGPDGLTDEQAQAAVETVEECVEQAESALGHLLSERLGAGWTARAAQ